METHLFQICTDRECSSSIASYGPEIRRLSQAATVILCVVEDLPLPSSVTERHRLAAADIAGVNGSRAVVLSHQDWLNMIDGVRLPEAASCLRSAEGVSYGRGFNKSNLVAAALGASVVHRRDSDTFLPEECALLGMMPVDVELEVLNINANVDVVGGNYWGAFNTNLHAFSTNPERFREILAINGVPAFAHDHVLTSQIPDASRPPVADRGSLTKGAYPDLGNCAYRLHSALELPAPFVLETQGTDYYFLAALVQLGRAWRHQVRLKHIQSENRGEIDYLFHYWVRKARQMDLAFMLRRLRQGLPTPGSLSEYKAGLAFACQRLQPMAQSLESERYVHWLAFAHAFRGTELDRAKQIGEHIIASADSIQGQTNAAIAEYGQLIADWSRIQFSILEAVAAALSKLIRNA